MNLSEIVDSIQKKVDDETGAKIADDLANILVVEENNTNTIKDKDDTIKRYKDDKEMLIQANGRLLQQVPTSQKDDGFTENPKKEDNKPFDFRTIFDEKGYIKR